MKRAPSARSPRVYHSPGLTLRLAPSSCSRPAGNDAIEADIILERVGPRHVVIIGILQPYGHAAGLVDLARQREPALSPMQDKTKSERARED